MKKLISLMLALAMVLGSCAFAFAEGSFADVAEGRWYTPYVERAFSEGVINGTGFTEDGSRLFTPDGTLTYAQFTAILARKFFPEDMAVSEFPDAVAKRIGSADLASWWAPAYYTCVKNSLLMKDISPQDFKTKPIPRKDMAFIVYSIAELLGFEISVSDAEIEAVPDHVLAAEGEDLGTASAYMIVIAACYKLGIINGVNAAGDFRPSGFVNRAQAATIYCRAVDVFGALSLQEDVLELVNEERAKEGLEPLAFNDVLQKAADIRAAETVELFSHTRPDGGDCFSVISDSDRQLFTKLGENIAAGASDAVSVMQAWMDSEGHRSNIMNPDFDSIGIGYVYDPEAPYTHYWVQLFGNLR